MAIARKAGWATGLAAIVFSVPAMADVKDGVDAWSRGDYAAAVAQWQEPAEADDPDALFDLGQAYRLGLGVEADQAKAENFYARAAARGHMRAADIYGLMLFESGRKEAAMPYIENAAKRGDPRSQYLLGVAHFNGDLASKDWVLAYALLTLSNGQGLPQAAPAIAEMDRYIPFAQRQQAAGLAVSMQQQADAARASDVAAFDLGAPGSDLSGPSAAPPLASAAGPLPNASPRVPQPIASTPIEPSLAAARMAMQDAAVASGTGSPGEAGADYARPAGAVPPIPPLNTPRSSAAPARVAVKQPAIPPAAPATAAAPAAAPASRPAASAASGPWKLQLGAFGVSGNAERLWARLSSRPELAGKKRLLVPAGKLTKLLAGGFATRADAANACVRLKAAGQSCIVTQ